MSELGPTPPRDLYHVTSAPNKTKIKLQKRNVQLHIYEVKWLVLAALVTTSHQIEGPLMCNQRSICQFNMYLDLSFQKL